MNKFTAANIFVSILLLAQLLIGLGLSIWVLPVNLGTPELIVLNQVLGIFLPCVIFTGVMCRKSGLTAAEYLRINPISGQNIILVVLMCMVAQPLMGAVSFLSTFFYPNEVSDLAVELFNSVSFLTMVVIMAVTPALFEELATRGVILSAYGKELGIKRTIMLNGLFFGMMHLNGQQFLYAMILGIFFAFLVIKTNSLLASIIGHFTINLSQVITVGAVSGYLESTGYDYKELANTADTLPSSGVAELVVVIIIFSLYFAVCCFILLKLFKRFMTINKGLPGAKAGDCEAVGQAEGLINTERLKHVVFENRFLNPPFYISLFASVCIFFAFMALSGINAAQAVFLLVIFAVFFLIFFLFRVGSQ